ncbi:MAG: winged helix-turn-helix domain-containing protein [Solirubrobacteraceae bacterium]|nr:winged helix-turn-helix domain-containing protein [Patulibacter sp.]
MNEVWIIGAPGELTACVDRTLAELGFQPRRSGPSEPLPVGTATRLPSLLVLVDEVEQMAGRLADHEELGKLPIVVVADDERLATGAYAAVGHELLVHPFTAVEFQTRLARARHALRGPETDEIVVSGTLEINTATYQVRVDGQAVDFTYMEYELLKFFVTHPDRVFTREALLSNVWGYDYYGGARTVDVHIRRVRAKLGHEHADRIRTLRSVGYRWDSRGGR